VNPALRSVVLGVDADGLDLKTQTDMAEDAHAGLDAAAKAAQAGRLFVVDHATLIDDLNGVLDDMDGRVIQPPFDVTPIFMPGLEGRFCPLFIVTRETSTTISLMTAFPTRNAETFFWGVTGFAKGSEKMRRNYAMALLSAIDARNLKLIGPPR
jgi:hypothetical protein